MVVCGDSIKWSRHDWQGYHVISGSSLPTAIKDGKIDVWRKAVNGKEDEAS
jgi:hypothetical protein